MTSRSRDRRRTQPELPSLSIGQVVRAVLAILTLAVLVLGMPLALWALGSSLSPLEGVDLSRLGSALTAPDDGSLFLFVILLTGWGAWAVFCLSVIVEVVALLRGLPSPQLPLLRLPQQGAALLVATAALLVVPASTSPHAPVARPVATTVVADVSGSRSDVHVPRADQQPLQAAVVAGSRRPNHYPTVTVRRHDTLWAIAESHLGSGERFREIVDLNRGRTQPDGRALTDASWIYPGWILRLPEDARVTPAPRAAESAEAHQPNKPYVVVSGDSLWTIAEDELGDGHRYGEIFELNQDREQPGGRRLTDPDEIRPGWQLRLPESPPVAKGETGVDTATENGPVADATTAPRLPSLPAETPAGAGAATPSPGTRSSATESTAEAEEHRNSIAPELVLGLGAITLTGLVAELTRRRRLQQRSRRVGERIDMPPPAPEAAERQARGSADPVTVETLKVALRMLAQSCRDMRRPLPDIALVRVSASAIELCVHTHDVDPVPPPFRAGPAGTWWLDSLPEAPIDDDLTDPFPALVTLGVDGDSLVLLNPEAFGSVTVVGPPDATESVLRALAVELAIGPFAGGTTLTFVDSFVDLASVVDSGRARHVAGSSSAIREIEVRSDSVRRVLESSGVANMREARARGAASDVTAPEILIATEELRGAPGPWSGVAFLMMNRSVPDNAPCTIRIASDTSARLEPLGLDVIPQSLSRSDYDQMVSLLGTALPPEELDPDGDLAWGHQASLDLTEDRASALEVLPEPHEAPSSDVTSERDPPRLLLLGKVHVEGADDAAAPGRRRRATEFVAFLALHPGATTHQIDEAMWPGKRVAKNTRNPFVSRVRQWLGRTTGGEPYLPLVADGGEYRLRPEVTSDWHDFLRLARRGLSQGPDGVEDLTTALQLVRGRPLLGIDPATYTWAEADVQEMISAIVDVAHVLSATRCDAGDHRGAQEAAAIGLLVDSCSEVLYRDAIRAAAARGDRAEAERLAERLREELALLDPEDGVSSETAELLALVKGP